MWSLTKAAIVLSALLATGTVLAQGGGSPGPGQAAPAAQATSAPSAAAPSRSRGELLAIAGDCAGCHADPKGGSEYSGGLALETPMGTVHARNITPDPATGIGGWTLAEFDQALRFGKSKAVGRLYPAMPYTSYRYMTDEDVKVLYEYLMKEVKPVNRKVAETDLGFPFMRFSMMFWDLLFAESGKAPAIPNAGDQVKRGQYLVDVLGHCGECHTPRGMMFQSRSGSAHLGGAAVSGWYAPNITSDKTGIGGWTDQRLKQFLMHGKDRQVIAGGDMGLAVRMSLAKLPESDVDAMVAYLKATRPVPGTPLAPVLSKVAPINLSEAEPVNGDYKSFFDTGSTNGELLYLSACASCHGVDGSLINGPGPSLTQNETVRASTPINVVQAIANGLNLGELDNDQLMPSFRSELSNAQIAAVATYVRRRFGGFDESIGESQVAGILDGSANVPWLLRNARWLAWLGVIAAIAAAVLGVRRLARRRG